MDLADFVTFDVRTLQGSAATAFSLGAVRVQAGRIAQKWQWTFRPVVKAPAASGEFMSWALQDAPEFEQLWPHIRECLGTDIMMAHDSDNVTDQVADLLDHYGLDLDPRPVLSSQELAQQVLPHLESYDLSYLSHVVGLPDFSPTNPADTAESCARLAIRVMQGFTEAEYEEAVWRSMLHGPGSQGQWCTVPQPRTRASCLAPTREVDGRERGSAA